MYPLFLTPEIRWASLGCSLRVLSDPNAVAGTVLWSISRERYAAGRVPDRARAAWHVLPRRADVVYSARRLLVLVHHAIADEHVTNGWPALLITCGTMPDPTEKGNFDDMIDLVTKPSQDPSSSVSSFIYVYYTEAVMYALPIDQCRSWFVRIAPGHVASA